MNIGIIIIGNEILSGSIADTNSHYLSRRLFACGARVGEICTIPDEVESVAGKVREYSDRFDLVITTGGIGPTHDDITFQAVAQAFEADLVVHLELEKISTSRYGRPNEAARKLMMVPAGSELLEGGKFVWPPVKMNNVVVLPGIPLLVEAQFSAIERLLPGSSFCVEQVKCLGREVDLADAAGRVSDRFPEVEVGSYPILSSEGNYVTVRFTGRDADDTRQALESFLGAIPPGVRTEPVEPHNT